MGLLIVISLLAAGLAVTVFVHAVRHAREGHEDELGFHPERKEIAGSRPKTRSTRKRQPAASRPFNARPVAGM